MIARLLGDLWAVFGIVGPTLATFVLIEIVGRLREK
jgi:hypothetical protein